MGQGHQVVGRQGGMMSRGCGSRWLAAAAAICLSPPCAAQAYPAKTVRLVVTAAPGGSDDFQGRLVAQKLSEMLGQPVVVESRPGGGAMIGREHVARAAPDGYTLLLAGGTLATVPALRPDAPFDVQRDFDPVSLVSRFPFVLMAHPAVPAKSAGDLVRLARTAPGRVSYGSSGAGLNPHLAAEMLSLAAKVRFANITYKGSAPAYAELAAGKVDVMFGAIAAVLPQVRGGKVRALGVTTVKRTQLLPDVPAISESGVPGYEFPAWIAVFGPARVAPDTVDRLNGAINRVVALPEVRSRMLDAGIEPAGSTPAELAGILKSDIAKMGKVIRAAGIKPE